MAYESDETIYYRFLREGLNEDMKELMCRHRESLTLFLYGIVHNMDDAEELMIDAFAEAGMGHSIFRGKCSFKTWLFAIGRNLALKHIRKNKYNSLFENDVNGNASDDTPEQELLRRERDRILYYAMENLNPDYRQILYLIYFEDMSIEEAGKVMKKNRKQVYNLIHRGREALKHLLSKEEIDLYMDL